MNKMTGLNPKRPRPRNKPKSRPRSNGWNPNPNDPEDRLNFEALRGAQADKTEDLPTKPGFYSDVLCGAAEYDDWLRRFSDKRPGSQIVKIDDRPIGRWAVCEVLYNITTDFRPQYAAMGRDVLARTGETYESFIAQWEEAGYLEM